MRFQGEADFCQGSRPTLVDGHPGPGSLLVVHYLEIRRHDTFSWHNCPCTRLFVDKSRYTSSDLQPWAVDVAQIINKIRHNLNEGKSTYPSTRRRPSSEQYQCWAGRLSEAWWLKHLSFTCDRGCGPENLGYHSWRNPCGFERDGRRPDDTLVHPTRDTRILHDRKYRSNLQADRKDNGTWRCHTIHVESTSESGVHLRVENCWIFLTLHVSQDTSGV